MKKYLCYVIVATTVMSFCLNFKVEAKSTKLFVVKEKTMDSTEESYRMSYDYNANGLLKKETENDGEYRAVYTYKKNKIMKVRKGYGNNISKERWKYDSKNKLDQIVITHIIDFQNKKTKEIEMINYLYDKNGLLKKRAQKSRSGVVVNYYSYNKRNELIKNITTYGYEKNNSQSQRYAYDIHGNISKILFDYGDNFVFLYNNTYDDNKLIKQTYNLADDSSALCTFKYNKVLVPEDMKATVKKQQWCIINDMEFE